MIRGAVESWYKVTLTREDVIAGKGLQLQAKFNACFLRNRIEAQKDVLLFSRRALGGLIETMIGSAGKKVLALYRFPYGGVQSRAPGTLTSPSFQGSPMSGEPFLFSGLQTRMSGLNLLQSGIIPAPTES